MEATAPPVSPLEHPLDPKSGNNSQIGNNSESGNCGKSEGKSEETVVEVLEDKRKKDISQ